MTQTVLVNSIYWCLVHSASAWKKTRTVCSLMVKNRQSHENLWPVRLMGHVRYINFLSFFSSSIPKRDLDTKKTTADIAEVCLECPRACHVRILICQTWPTCISTYFCCWFCCCCLFAKQFTFHLSRNLSAKTMWQDSKRTYLKGISQTGWDFRWSKTPIWHLDHTCTSLELLMIISSSCMWQRSLFATLFPGSSLSS